MSFESPVIVRSDPIKSFSEIHGRFFAAQPTVYPSVTMLKEPSGELSSKINNQCTCIQKHLIFTFYTGIHLCAI